MQMQSLFQEERNEEVEAIEILCGESPAVEIWRRHFKLNTSRGRKYDINMTVKDLKLWDWLLSNWGFYQKNGRWKSFNPLAVNHQISEYERLAESREAREIAGYQP